MDLVKIMEKKADGSKTIVICEGWDERAIRVAADFMKNNFAKIILIGSEKLISETARKIKVNIYGVQIIDPQKYDISLMIEKLVELRSKKGMTKNKAKELLQDVNYFGCMLVAIGKADAVAGSLICSTAEFMKPALQILKNTMASETSIMRDKRNGKIYFLSDLSMGISPNAKELSQIAFNAMSCVKDFDIKPIVGMLSYSTKGSGGDGDDLQVIRDAISIVHKQDQGVEIDGEFQFDAAIDINSAKRKCPESKIAGRCNTLIFPNLMASNIFAHAMMQFSELEYEFTMIKGLAKPVAILGRTTSLKLVRNMLLSLAI